MRQRRCRNCRRPVQQTAMRAGYCKACINVQREEYAAVRTLADEMGVEVNADTRPALVELVQEMTGGR